MLLSHLLKMHAMVQARKRRAASVGFLRDARFHGSHGRFLAWQWYVGKFLGEPGRLIDGIFNTLVSLVNFLPLFSM
jgi:hypothetical protein